jgi:hypothetical protein
VNWRAVILGLCLASVGQTAHGLEVRVRGETHLEVDARGLGTTLAVEGRLTDDRGVGLPLEPVDLVVREGEREGARRVNTDYNGRFATTFELSPGTTTVEARFAGGVHLVSSQADAEAELEVAPAMLSLYAPSWVHGEQVPAPLRIQATIGGQGLSTSATVSVDGHPLETITLDRQGRATVDVGRALRQGRQVVSVSLAETPYRAGVTAEIEMQRVARLRVHGQVDRVMRRLAQGVEVVIALNDGTDGVPDADLRLLLIPIESVSEDGSPPMERRFRTDRRGRGTAFFPHNELGDRRYRAHVDVIPPAGESVRWESEEVYFEASPLTPWIPWLGAIGVLLGFVWIGRSAVWRLLRQLRDWLPNRAEAAEAEAPRFESEEALAFKALPKALDSASKEAHTTALVQVWDPWMSLPVVGARLRVVEGNEGELVSDEQGLVDLGEAARLSSDLVVEAVGYVAARARLPFPGGKRGVRVELTAVPLKIRAMYRWMLTQTAGQDHWGRLTPREIEVALLELEGILERLKASDGPQGEALLKELTGLIEETNFSGLLYEQPWWERSRNLMEELLHMMRTEDLR